MKKFLLLCGLFTMAMLTFAQETKKVAILEVVDREGQLSYSQKMMLRSNMARAIANTPGYEAYDRSDVDAIMSEQDFQRSGLVSDAEIRKLGEMTGVSLILVTEAVVTGSDKLFVSAKILNVETARVEMMDNVNMDINNMQEGCDILATRLFGVKSIGSASVKNYEISCIGKGKYSYQNKTLDEEAYIKFLGKNCSDAYTQYIKGKRMVKGGWITFAMGLFFTGAGTTLMCVSSKMYANYKSEVFEKERAIREITIKLEMKYGGNWSEGESAWNYYSDMYRDEEDVKEAAPKINAYYEEIKSLGQYNNNTIDPIDKAGIGTLVAGSCLTVTSIPLLCLGYKAKKKSVDVYNENCVSSSAQTLSLNLTSGREGIGLALHF